MKGLSGVIEITSTSQEDYSMIIVEFDDEMNVEVAKQRVKDKIDAEKHLKIGPLLMAQK